MGFEIEHKFVVDPSKITAKSLGIGSRLIQGYLSDKPTVRIRIIDDVRAELTIKGKGTIIKPEFNYSIPVADAIAMQPMLKASLEKTRYHVRFKGFVWDVDEFHGPLAGLWLAEIELPSIDTKFKIPTWAIKNVTEDRRYSNSNLASKGLPPDDKSG
jgi:adenylate cyclase